MFKSLKSHHNYIIQRRRSILLIHTCVVTEPGGGEGEKMAVVYRPGKGVYILI